MTIQYSPSETKTFITCPTLWALEKLWEPAGEWSPKFIYGQAVGKAFEIWIPDAFSGSDLSAFAVETALKFVADEWVENDAWTLDAMQLVVKKGILAAFKSTLADIVKQERLVSVEDRLGKGEFEKGAARMDLITQLDDLMIVTDHKTKLRSRADYVEKDLADSVHEHQFWDYAWRVWQHYRPARIAFRVHIGVLTPSPKWVFGPVVEIAPEMLEHWAKGMEREWTLIELSYNAPLEALPMHLQNCTTRYGKCVMYDACHTCQLKDDRIATFYNPKQRRMK